MSYIYIYDISRLRFNKSEISDSHSGECDDNSLLSSDVMHYCEQYIDVSENYPP